MYLGQADISSSNVVDQRMVDPMRRNGGLTEETEFTKYAKTKHGIYGIFYNASRLALDLFREEKARKTSGTRVVMTGTYLETC